MRSFWNPCFAYYSRPVSAKRFCPRQQLEETLLLLMISEYIVTLLSFHHWIVRYQHLLLCSCCVGRLVVRRCWTAQMNSTKLATSPSTKRRPCTTCSPSPSCATRNSNSCHRLFLKNLTQLKKLNYYGIFLPVSSLSSVPWNSRSMSFISGINLRWLWSALKRYNIHSV